MIVVTVKTADGKEKKLNTLMEDTAGIIKLFEARGMKVISLLKKKGGNA